MVLEVSPNNYKAMEVSSERDHVSDGVPSFSNCLHLVSWQSSSLFFVTDKL
jgi:hypothetical protein